jgi:hypothetical protein
VFNLGHLSPEIRWRRPGGAGGPTPAFQTDFTAISSLPAGISFSRASNAMMFDSTGNLTYGPNNLVLNSTVPTANGSAAVVTGGFSDPDGGTNGRQITFTNINQEYYWFSGGLGKTISSIWVKGTASETISLYASDTEHSLFTFNGSWQQIYVLGINANGNRYVDISTLDGATARVFQFYKPVLAQVTYETTPRTQDQVLTTGSAYYGPRFDYSYNGSVWVPKGLLDEEQRANLYLQSGSPANQTITVANGTAYTVSFYGTGTLTLSGAATQTMNGTGANVRTSYTFTASTTSLVIAVSGTVTYPNVEAGSFPTSYIPTTSAAVTRSADIPSSSSPLTGYLAAGPSVWEFQDEATGVIARSAYAAGAFDWPVNRWYRSMGVYPSGTDTSGHMVVGSGY